MYGVATNDNNLQTLHSFLGTKKIAMQSHAIIRGSADRLSVEEIKAELQQDNALDLSDVCRLTHGHEAVDRTLKWQPGFPLVNLAYHPEKGEKNLYIVCRPALSHENFSDPKSFT